MMVMGWVAIITMASGHATTKPIMQASSRAAPVWIKSDMRSPTSDRTTAASVASWEHTALLECSSSSNHATSKVITRVKMSSRTRFVSLSPMLAKL
ncbi:hypothetical protein M758_2G057100 [Ceratodon purpureus]|nr:hypothetical protein M758_2G057100 [Ceratodon purpureus]